MTDDLIAWTEQGTQTKPLHRHTWSQEDGMAMADFRAELSRSGKGDFSEIQGESFGDRYAKEHLGYQEVFHADSKSIAQGFDSVYWDPKQEAVVVLEYKGQMSHESRLQQQSAWTIERCEKICKREGVYQSVSEYERGAAEQILQAYEKGVPIRYEVARTYVEPKTKQLYTQIEKRTRLEKELRYEPGRQGIQKQFGQQKAEMQQAQQFSQGLQ